MKPKLIKIDLTNPQDRTRIDGRGYGLKTNPYSVFFVYAPQGNYMVTGYRQIVQAYVRQHFPICVCRYTYWKKGNTRGKWNFEGAHCHIDMASSSARKNKHVFHGWVDGKRVEFLRLKRIPNKWIPEYDEIIRRLT